MPATEQFPLQTTWWVVLATIPVPGLAAFVVAGAELAGLVPRGALLRPVAPMTATFGGARFDDT